nr:ribonuclease H-like domain-containing protein [Tanacetum cinerariifolium]
MDQREDFLDRDKSADKGSDNTNEMSHVLGSLEAANILASRGLRSVFTTASISVATVSTYISPAVATASGSFPTAIIFTTASVATPTTIVTRSSQGVVVGSSSPIPVNIPSISKKDKGKWKMTEPEQPSKEKRDSEIAMIHTKKELEMMIAKPDKSNEMVAKYLSEYEQAAVGLSHDEKKAKDFKGTTFEQIKEKFIPVWEKMQDFVPVNSKLESERLKRPGIQLDTERSKKLKTAKASGTEPTQEQQSEEPKELYEEELKKMMELVRVEELFIEALQALQRYMHDPLVWRLYDTCGVHHVSTGRGHHIFMLVEKDYPLTKGLTTLMVSNKLQVYQYSKMANELLMKIYIIANSLDNKMFGSILSRLSVPTADVYIAKKLATIEDFALLHEDKIYSESKARYLQHKHYDLWEVKEFGDSYKAPSEETAKDKGPAGEVSSSTKKKGRTMAITAEDMQKRKNDVNARTTLLLQAIVSHLEFMDVPIEQDDLNQKFLTSLAPEWLMYTIAWRNREDLNTMSLDDVYNHLKVYEPEVELINELIMHPKYLSQIKKYQAQQNKPATKTERINFYMSILRSNAGWKAKDFKGTTFEQIEEKFIPVWEKMQDFVPVNSKLESERLKRPGIQLDKERSNKLKIAKASGTEPTQEQQSKEPKELYEEELKKMMELVRVEELFIEALQSLVKETCSTIEVTNEKAKELWVELKRLYEPDSRDLLWALQRYMHDPLVWRLYDTCGVHHVSTGRGHHIFMLVEKDYLLTKGLMTLMVSNKLQVYQYSKMANELLMKIYIIANSLDNKMFGSILSRLSVPTADVYIAKKLATIEYFALLHEDKIYSESKAREVREFGNSYKAPSEETAKDKGPAGELSSSTKKKGRTMAITAEDMQKRKNDVNARTTLLLQAIISHLEFMDVPIEQDDLNQKFLTSLAPEWLMYTIVWRNRDDLDTISLDDVYNHLKVYEPEPNGSQIKHEDISQIDDDGIEEMDIKWNLALLSIRADRKNTENLNTKISKLNEELSDCETDFITTKEVYHKLRLD